MQETEIIEQLAHLQVTRDFEQSFYQATGLSVRLTQLGIWNLACASLHQKGRFSRIIVTPVSLGDRIIGVLQTGPAEIGESNQFADPKEEVSNEATSKTPNRSSNRCVPIFSRSCYEAMVDMLEIFAEQLSLYAKAQR
jgi:hypothetical protein